MPEPMHRKHRSKQDYETPNDLLDAVRARLSISEFAFDFAATKQNAKAGRYWTSEDDSLSKTPMQWARRCNELVDGWGWLNPPYTNIGPWVYACACAKIEGARIAMLVPAGVGSNWFRDYVAGDARVLFLNGRITFVGSTDCYPKDSLLLLWDNALEDGYEVWTWPGEMGRVPEVPARVPTSAARGLARGGSVR